MRDLAVLIPTRGRPGNVRKVIGAWDFTNAWDVADMYLLVDEDDPEIEGYRKLFEEHRHPDTDEALLHLVQYAIWQPMVHKLNSSASAVALSHRYFALAFAGDDHMPRTINWAQRYLSVLRELGTGMVYSDDGFRGQELSTEWAVTADAVRELGRMVPAPVEHLYCDDSMMALYGGAGALRYLPEVRIEHMTPFAGKTGTDAQYRRVNGQSQYRKDGASFNAWRTSGLEQDMEVVRALRPGLPEVRPEMPDRPVTGPVKIFNRDHPRPRSGPSQRRRDAVRFPFTSEFKQVRGATPDEIGMALADFASQVPADQEIVELGVFQGRTALIMAWGSRQGHGAHVTGIDAWDLEGNTYGPPFNEGASRIWAEYRIRELDYERDITLVQNFASDAAATWVLESDAKQIGLLFIDDDHSYAGARRAVEDWAPHLAPGAVIAIDDYEHPDWPGVAEAVNDLVSEGVLAPITIYHDRLAVTRLAADPAVGWGDPASDPLADTVKAIDQIKTITGEGVSPSPYPAADGQVAVPYEVTESPVLQPVDAEVSRRGYVQPDELIDVEPATPIKDLNLVNLKALAKARGIVLGARKDLRSEILNALLEGK